MDVEAEEAGMTVAVALGAVRDDGKDADEAVGRSEGSTGKPAREEDGSRCPSVAAGGPTSTGSSSFSILPAPAPAPVPAPTPVPGGGCAGVADAGMKADEDAEAEDEAEGKGKGKDENRRSGGGARVPPRTGCAASACGANDAATLARADGALGARAPSIASPIAAFPVEDEEEEGKGWKGPVDGREPDARGRAPAPARVPLSDMPAEEAVHERASG
jgi:hypothetical protein